MTIRLIEKNGAYYAASKLDNARLQLTGLDGTGKKCGGYVNLKLLTAYVKARGFVIEIQNV